MSGLALDTSVAVPLLVATHREHAAVVRWCDGRDVALSGHAVAETYSVLTRLPGDLRVLPEDAARLLRERFATPLLLGRKVAARLPDKLSALGIAGGAVYDALSGSPPWSTTRSSRRATRAPERPMKRSAHAWSSPAEPGGEGRRSTLRR